MIHGMKSKMVILVLGLLLLPIKAIGQSSEAEIIGPTPFRVAEPARWRDGYIGWRGRKIFGPDWRTFKAENGGTFVVDVKSIANISRTGLLVRVVAYLVEGEDFEPKNLITFAFNCKDFAEVVGRVPYEWGQSVEERAQKLACHWNNRLDPKSIHVRFGCAPWQGGAFQWVQAPPGKRSSRKQPEQLWR
jgi:hypothetical protein